MKKIFIVEPDRNLTGTLQQLLETESYSVSVAASVEESLAKLETEHYDLVLFNPGSENCGERDFVEWLLRISPDTKVILLGEENREQLSRDNVVGLYPPPVRLPAIISGVKSNLRGKGFSGVLRDVKLEDYIQIFCMNRTTKAILVTKDEQKGIILIKDGGVMYAVLGEVKGEQAFYEILSWKSGKFKEVKVKRFPPGNIDKDYGFLLLEASNYADNKAIAATETPPDTSLSPIPEEVLEQLASAEVLHEEQVVEDEGGSVEPDNRLFREKFEEKKSLEKKKKSRKMTLALAALIPVLALFVYGTYHVVDGQHQLPGFAGASPQPLKTKLEMVQSRENSHLLSANEVAAAGGRVEQDGQNSSSAHHVERGNGAASVAATGEGAKLGGTELSQAHEQLAENSGTTTATTSDSSQTAAKFRQLPERLIMRLHGSNTVGAKLAPALVKRYLLEDLGAETVREVPGEKENELFLKALFQTHIKVVEIKAHGSSTGFQGMVAGRCDIAMASRKIKSKEVDKLTHFGDMTAPTNEHVIALDGIAVIVNKANDMTKISKKALASIFSGRVTEWNQLGVKGGTINVYARDDNSGTYDTFKSIVLGKKNPLVESARRFESNPELSAEVARDPDGIGFTSLPNVNGAKALAVSDDGAAAIYPSFFTVSTEDYPISRRLYLYTESNPESIHVRNFIEFVHSYGGQETVKDIGLVDMNIKPFYAERIDPRKIIQPEMVAQYVTLPEKARRLSLNFRFRSGETELDNRALRDLDRVIGFLKDKYDRKVVLAGFADNAGEYDFNYKLAGNRAETVAEQLRARGVSISDVLSCGEELPVASNFSSNGREKNRRVEIWLQ